ncbi:MAG: MBL fold metallo-hydrolase [Candidatus Electryonea clarkiae]|nr:MBL fold metallo-hydrolase [Candidatus Electryonea clarkiae]MDP8289095.1 MBL fold metallo-hydrolase [Candidatus Electryonea clarkiae]
MKFGDFELFIIDDGKFRLDGGAMFGIVPKVLWSKTDESDENNRILLSANCLLIKTGKDVVLIDNGMGGKWNDKSSEMFAVEQPRRLMKELAGYGVAKEDLTHMILSHLHFDHAGGSTYIDDNGQVTPQFPNARYIMQKGEWDVAHNPTPRDKASYLPDNLDPLMEAGLVQLVDGDTEVLPGITMIRTGGHTDYHCIIRIESGGNTAWFLADLIPTSSHVQVPFVMGYDLFPQKTMEFKEKFLKEAFEENHLLIFEHGPVLKAGHLGKNERGKWIVKKFDTGVANYPG